MKQLKVIEPSLIEDFKPIIDLITTLNKMFSVESSLMFESEFENYNLYIYGNSINTTNLYSLLWSTTKDYSFYIHWSIEYGQYIEVIKLM